MKFLNALIAITAITFAAATANAADYDSLYADTPIELARVQPVTFPDRTVSITDFGAIGDGVTLCTDAFQTAIDQLAAEGGGHLIVPQGVWLTGPIELKSNVDLHLERNALVYFSPDKALYVDPAPKASRVKPCITAYKAKNIGITGSGTIDGNGRQWRPVKVGKVSETELKEFQELGGVMRDNDKLWYPWDSAYGYENVAKTPEKQEKMRNDLFRVFYCTNILLEGVTFQNAPKFHVHPFNSENVILDRITVRCPWNAQNGDAIDISDCHRVLIVGCTVDCGDDGLCMKSGTPKPGYVNGCQDILIQDNTVYRAHGGFVVGSETIAGVSKIVVRNCTFSGTDIGLRFKSGIGRGGTTTDLHISNITMADIRNAAILFECTYADRPAGHVADPKLSPEELTLTPRFCDIDISNIVCEAVPVGVSASGINGLDCVSGINISNSTFIYTSQPDRIDAATAKVNLSDCRFVKLAKE